MDELLGRSVPHSERAEQAVIGSMLIDPECIPVVLEFLKADEFYSQVNRDIYETLYSMFAYGLTIDAVTLIDRLKVRGVYSDNTEDYVYSVVAQTPTSSNVKEYANIVKERALLRRLGEAADNIREMVYEGSGEADSVLEAAEKQIYALRSGRNIGRLLPVSSVVQNVFDQLNEAAESGDKIPGIPTGLPDLDNVTLGLNKSELIIIAARPGMGKTSIALNIALHAAMNEKKSVAIFSLEMSREQLVTRLLSKAALVPAKNLLTGHLTEQQWKDIASAAQALSETDILIDDNSSVTVADISAQCRRLKKLDLIVIDYLQLMGSSGSGRSWSNESRTQAVSDISRMMKITAKELNVPVICLSQLSRASEGRQDKRPVLSDLRESGAIEQDADVVIGLYRQGYHDKDAEDPNLAEAIVLKNRKGRTDTVELNWIPEYTSFGSRDTTHEDDY
ncbi:MAG: replicative DNA helicase [Oscillospiraceae bacterium]|nr:replicative DNA helicase [Oscillospiraceae bacterium]